MQHHETFIEENKNIIYELDRKISFTTTKWVCSSSMSTTILEIKWKQKVPLGLVEQPPTRASFNTRYFVRQLDLGLPVATVYFNSQKEPAAKRR